MALILVMFFSMITMPGAASAAPHAGDSPFAAMYSSDSDALFAEKAAPILRERQTRAKLEAAMNDAPGSKGQAPSGDEMAQIGENGLGLAVEAVLMAAKRGDTATIEGLATSGGAELIGQIYNDTREDRYIVKYKNSNDSIAGTPGISIKSSKRINAENGGSEYEVIELAGRENPAELADRLKSAGVENRLVFIQPDFRMEFAGYMLSVGEGGPETGIDRPETGEGAGNGGLEQETATGNDGVETAPPEEGQGMGQTENETGGDAEARPVTVALIDTAVDIYHEALQSHIADGWNFVNNTGEVFDPALPMSASHGTHIAGIIASVGGESAKIMPLQVFSPHGAYTSDIIAAIYYAEEHGATIANMSFGSTSYNQALYEAMEISGMLFVTSVGNSRSDLGEEPVYPAAFELENNICAASTNLDGGFSYYSSYSAEIVDIAALGRDVNSALPGNKYGNMTGTSMSAGYVSGAAAAVSAYEELTAAGLKTRLTSTADRLSNLQGKVKQGRRINLENALGNIVQTQITQNEPEDDFDVHGYNPTQGELYELFSASGSAVQVAAGGSITLVLTQNGYVFAFGDGLYGQRGNGTSGFDIDKSISRVIGLSNVVAIEAGDKNCFAIKSDGTLWAWGSNSYGALGDGTNAMRTVPIQVMGIQNVKTVTAGEDRSLAIKTDGTLWAWGNNSQALFGNGGPVDLKEPAQVDGISGVASVSAGSGYTSNHVLAATGTGSLYAWGDNGYGQLGNGTTTGSLTPILINALTNVKTVEAGQYHSFAIKTDGTLWAWGNNSFGKLGIGTSINSSVPVQVALSGVAEISSEYYHALARKTDGSIWAWGSNNYGMLGIGSYGSSTSPVLISSMADVTGISAGGLHSVAVKSDGTVWGWGENSYGQLGPDVGSNQNIPVQLFVEANTRTIHGLVQYMVENDWGLGEPFLRKHDIAVELREDFATPATPNLCTTAVLVPNTSGTGLGEFTIENVPYGDYVLYIKRPGYLVRCMNINISATDPDVVELTPPPTDPADNGLFRLWWGDCNGDLTVDDDDGAMVQGLFNVNARSPLYDPACDLNGDGLIDILDLLMLFDKFGCCAWDYAGAGDVDFFLDPPTASPTIELAVTQGGEYLVTLSAYNMKSFSGKTMTVTYDPLALQLVDAAAHAYGTHASVGAVPGTGITVTTMTPGSVALEFDKPIPQGKAWTGPVTVLKFKALATGVTTVSV